MLRSSCLHRASHSTGVRWLFAGLLGIWAGCNSIAGIRDGKPYPDACESAADCDLREPACRQTTCENERCVYVDAPRGIALPSEVQVQGDCQEVQCDGQGNRQLVSIEADALDDNEPCTQDTCVGSMQLHIPLAVVECYSGPPGSDQLGNCRKGILFCQDGKSMGSCMGERIPAPETCLTIFDDDCDGSVNEEGSGCICLPGSVGDCYPGNQETLGYGLCATGQQTCNSFGTAYEQCTNFVSPSLEVCDAALIDEDCDGLINESGANCSCGDGFVSNGETCDDGNLANGDTCTNECKIPGCGNEQVEMDEECDDGNGENTDNCTSQCKNASCGDGFLQLAANEECDDGNSIDTDACTTQCRLARCGDGLTQDGVETCDDGNVNNNDDCTMKCMLPTCGDGFVYVGFEECDDANTIETDGCTSLCKIDQCTMNCQPSCEGLANDCGPQANESCCDARSVPGGTFNRSNDSKYPATVSDFRLERFEVTVGRFRKFFEAYPSSRPSAGVGAHPAVGGSGWDSSWDSLIPADQAALDKHLKNGAQCLWTTTAGPDETKPINCVSWHVFFAFCAWDGGRMPTDAELNYAATGGDEQRVYPWSNPPGSTTVDHSFASYDCTEDGASGCALGDIIRVGAKSPQGDGRWGHADLAGNMQEYVRDYWNTNLPLPCNDCINLVPNSNWANRGGSWQTQAGTALGNDKRQNGSSPWRTPVRGGRCVRQP